MSDILLCTTSLPLAPKGECLPAVRGVLPFRGVRGVSDGKRQFTTDIALILLCFYIVLIMNW